MGGPYPGMAGGRKGVPTCIRVALGRREHDPMNVIPVVRSATSSPRARRALAMLLVAPLALATAQDAPAVARIAAQPATISIRMGETAKFTLIA